jgi:hypothetical protein
MSRPRGDLPEPLLAEEATDFERRLLEAALSKGPSAATSARMARALGVSLTVAAPAAAADALAAKAAANTEALKAAAAAGTTTVRAWIAAGLIGLAVTGAVVGTRVWSGSSHGARAPAAFPTAPIQPAPDPTSDLGSQIALLDAARAAVATGAQRQALDLLRRYEDKFPSGSFRPEATAVKVEALVKLGRRAEARAMAERFVAQNRGSLLARRVTELAGLPATPTP